MVPIWKSQVYIESSNQDDDDEEAADGFNVVGALFNGDITPPVDIFSVPGF